MMDEPENQKPSANQQQARLSILCALSLLVCLLIYGLRVDSVVGFFVDDAWYVVLAQALAAGQYALINSPTLGILPLYPPAFPFVLSLVYRLMPSFPANLWLLKSVSVLSAIGAGVALYRYFVRVRGLNPYFALGIALAVTLSPPLVFLATSTVMSECFFTLTFVLTILTVERARQATAQRQWLYLALAGVLASTTFLTRSLALGMIAGVFFYLLKERLLRGALVFALTVAVLCGPWVLYSNAHTPTLEQQQEQVGHIVQPYAKQFWQRLAGTEEFGQETWRDLPARMGRNLAQLGTVDLARSLATLVVEPLLAGEAGARPWSVALLSLFFLALTMVGFFQAWRERAGCAEWVVPFFLLVVLLWPWGPYRLILPLLPFLLYYLLLGLSAGLRWCWPAAAPFETKAASATLGLFVLLSLGGNLSYLLRQREVMGTGLASMFGDAEDLFKFMQTRLKPGEVIAAASPALVYLYTGHKTIGVGEPATREALWQRLGVRYVVNTDFAGRQEDPAKTGYPVVFRARRHPNQFWVIDVSQR